jgi:hypothetical protein
MKLLNIVSILAFAVFAQAETEKTPPADLVIEKTDVPEHCPQTAANGDHVQVHYVGIERSGDCSSPKLIISGICRLEHCSQMETSLIQATIVAIHCHSLVCTAYEMFNSLLSANGIQSFSCSRSRGRHSRVGWGNLGHVRGWRAHSHYPCFEGIWYAFDVTNWTEYIQLTFF